VIICKGGWFLFLLSHGQLCRGWTLVDDPEFTMSSTAFVLSLGDSNLYDLFNYVFLIVTIFTIKS